MWSRIAATAGLLFAAAGLALGDRDETIRVGLNYGGSAPESVAVVGRGVGQGERSRGTFDGEVEVRAERGEVVLEHKGRAHAVGRWLELWPGDDGEPLVLDGSAYRGKLRFEERRGRLQVINTLPVEDYVRGVVPNEMFEHPVAYEVQAVISRTLALYIRDLERKHRADGFDVCATGHCQVYAGAGSERPSSDAAVAATRGEVLTYRGRPIFSAYHANAGGLTEPVDAAWPGSVREAFPYLCTVRSPYDAAANGLPGYAWCYRWQHDVDLRELGERLRRRRRDVGRVRELAVRARTGTGRVRELEVVGDRGRTTIGSPGEVRALLAVPSPRFNIQQGPNGLELVGWGRGHGVGLSQHGALGMAKAGYTYPEILGHFYPGVALTRDYGRGDSQRLPQPELRTDPVELDPVSLPAGAS